MSKASADGYLLKNDDRNIDILNFEKFTASKEHSVAFVLTRYQYHILMAALKKLNIDKSSVAIIIAKKAQKQGVDGADFGKILLYDDKNESMKYWKELKKKIDGMLDEIDIYPQNIFLRNFNATISRVLMSRYSEVTLYLLEEGMPSYMYGNYMGCHSDFREKVKTLLTRVFFSKGALRILPVNRKKTVKVGLFENMKPWLDVPYLPIKLSQEDFKISKELLEKSRYDVEVLIIDQPLWQIGMSSEETRDIYESIFQHLTKKGIDDDRIGVKLHPSSDKKEFESLLSDLGHKGSIHIFDGKENIEEMLFSRQFKSIKIFVGFFSWALCLIQAHKPNDKAKVIAFADKVLIRKVKDAYRIMEDMGIKIERSDNGR